MQQSKDKARDALNQADDIESLIQTAEDRTQGARDALAGAESDAREAMLNKPPKYWLFPLSWSFSLNVQNMKSVEHKSRIMHTS